MRTMTWRATTDLFGAVEVGPAGPRTARLAVVGQSPGMEEEFAGEPFVGPAGQLLQHALHAAGVAWPTVYRTNVFRHRLLSGADLAEVQRAVDARRQALLDELAGLRSLRVIVALGNEAMFALLGRWGVLAHRGQWSGVHAVRASIVPTVHPAYVLRSRDARAEGWLFDDIRKAAKRCREKRSG